MLRFSKHRQILFILFLLFGFQSYSQKISGPEKWWAVKHIFKAKKALTLSKQAREVTQQVKQDSILIGSGNGQQVDAFRHTYWMALLTQNIGAKRAYRLGKAHEKGNYKTYKSNRKEDGVVPDKISSTMDLYNNNVGIAIGKTYKGYNLEQEVIKAVQSGKCKVILKDAKGNYLDTNSKVIPVDELFGTWENNKVLVWSNYFVK